MDMPGLSPKAFRVSAEIQIIIPAHLVVVTF